MFGYVMVMFAQCQKLKKYIFVSMYILVEITGPEFN